MSDGLIYFREKFPDLVVDENDLVDYYTPIVDEINSVKYGVGIYNRSESAVIRMKGKDVLDFLQRISTNDVLNLEPYHYVSTLFTNEKGRLIDRTVLISLEDEYFLVGSKRNDNLLFRWINKYIITEEVDCKNDTGNFMILDVIGPQAESYLTLICGKEVDNLDNNQLHKIEIDNTRSYLLKKTAASGENIYWLISENTYTIRILDYLLSHKSVFDLSMIGEKAFDYYRIINQVPKFPNEINDNFNPHETGLMKDVSENKGCYIGQEVVARLETYDKVQKILKKVRIDGLSESVVPIEFYQKDDELIGILTTSMKDATNGHFEGLAFIRKSFQEKNILEDIKTSAGDENIKLKIID